MKVCKNCGAIQKDSHSKCIDCGEYLGSPLSKESEKYVEAEVERKINKLSDRSSEKMDYFYVGRKAKIISALSAVGAIALIIQCFFQQEASIREVNIVLAVFMIANAIDFIFPQFFWELYILRARVYVDADFKSPSLLWIAKRNLLAYLLLLVGYVDIVIFLVGLIR